MTETKVFISYRRSQPDIDFVETLSKLLRAQSGVSVWLDSQEIKLGESWQKSIDQALRNADVVVLVLSPASSESEWVRNEIGLARKLDKVIIPILIAGEASSIEMLNLRDVQFVDARQNYENAISSLVTTLKRIRLPNP